MDLSKEEISGIDLSLAWADLLIFPIKRGHNHSTVTD